MTARTKQQLYDRFCSGGSAKNSISQIETEFEDLIDTFFGTWTDYSSTSTIVGWSSYTAKKIFYRKIGNLMFVQFGIAGTSDSTTSTFTVPSAQQSDIRVDTAHRAQNNGGANVAGLTYFEVSSTTVNLYSDMAGSAWTASGSKSCLGQFWYEAA